MKTKISSEFIRAIPKSDLHLHLDGSLRIPTLIELAKSHKIELPSYETEGLRELVFKDRYADLGEYLRGFAYTCAVLRDVESIERTAYELAEDNIAEGVRYIEVRFAPQLHVSNKLQLHEVVQAVSDGLARSAKAHNLTTAVQDGSDLPFEFGIIACAMRSINENMSPYFRRLFRLLPGAPHKELCSLASMEMARGAVELRDRYGLPIVGFDLAGEEAGYPASYHTKAYNYAHSHFMRKTVHAGEAYGPESIFQAITDCHSNRIGHGTFLFSADMINDENISNKETFINSLAEYIASQRITLEVCLTSNLQTVPAFNSVADHPICKMIDSNLSVSICTDNRLVSNTTVSQELELVTDSLCLDKTQFRNIVVAGFKGSFFAGGYRKKRAYVRKMMELYAEHEKQYLD
jgi:adenosine deaminase